MLYKDFNELVDKYLVNTQEIESGHTRNISRIIFYNNEKNFITCSWDEEIKFFDRISGNCLQTLINK